MNFKSELDSAIERNKKLKKQLQVNLKQNLLSSSPEDKGKGKN